MKFWVIDIWLYLTKSCYLSTSCLDWFFSRWFTTRYIDGNLKLPVATSVPKGNTLEYYISLGVKVGVEGEQLTAFIKEQ